MYDYDEDMELYFIKTMPTIQMTVQNDTTVVDIKRQLNDALKTEGIKPTDLLVGTMQRGKIVARLGDSTLVKDIRRSDEIMLYHLPKETLDMFAIELNWFKVGENGAV